MSEIFSWLNMRRVEMVGGPLDGVRMQIVDEIVICYPRGKPRVYHRYELTETDGVEKLVYQGTQDHVSSAYGAKDA